MATPNSTRVQRHRLALREAGLRPVQIWVPDTRRPAFAEECHRQSMLLQSDPLEQDILGFAEAVSDQEGWE